MDFESARRRIEELRETIDYHSRLYYDKDAPELEDDEFDKLTQAPGQITSYSQNIVFI